MTTLWLTSHVLCCRFGFYEDNIHPPYSLDLAPCDFFLFPKMKLKLKGRRSDSTEKIQTELQDMTKTLMRNDFQQCFQSWKSCWDHCINAEGGT